ncbi:MAG: hypothetical protein ACFBWO_11315 [Paracoccaceae bacterium]
MSGWRVEQLTFGSERGVGHAHSYYDIPVLDGAGRRVLAHRLRFAGRHPTPGDAVEVGIADAEAPGAWAPLGESRAWSWQQGPLAQWIAGGPWLTYADREEGRLVGRLADADTGARRTLDRPLYAVAPDGRFGLALDMGRIDALRPGYGFPAGEGVPAERAPGNEGVWRVDLGTGAARLVLPLDAAVAFLHRNLGPVARLRHRLSRPHYWFNHVKIAPDARRFTVKLRWRRPEGHWDDRQGVSLTASTEGGDLALLAEATSHVIWMDDRRLHLWRRGGIEEVEDAVPRGRRLGAFAGGAVGVNAHLRRLDGERFVWDTPYRETIELNEIDRATGRTTPIATFAGHRPANGPFRCDLHPCPSADGRRIIVTSLQDGARQVYALTRAA